MKLIAEQIPSESGWYRLAVWTRDSYLIDTFAVYDWCLEKFGPVSSKTWTYGDQMTYGVFKFRSEKDLLLTSLQWDGAEVDRKEFAR